MNILMFTTSTEAGIINSIKKIVCNHFLTCYFFIIYYWDTLATFASWKNTKKILSGYKRASCFLV
uniref:Uncharacterized protein n=1 Tax=Anguilla anguilla TaxID=7936 RepID=A0A0E9UXP0_ANGAN